MGCLVAKCCGCCPFQQRGMEVDDEGDTLLDVSQRFFRSPAMIRRDLETYFGFDKKNIAEEEGYKASEARRIALARAKAPT